MQSCLQHFGMRVPLWLKVIAVIKASGSSLHRLLIIMHLIISVISLLYNHIFLESR